jgi:hypothetical protein
VRCLEVIGVRVSFSGGSSGYVSVIGVISGVIEGLMRGYGGDD